MRRRILVAIVGVTAVATLVLTVPLVLIIARRENADSVLELQRAAQRASAELSTTPGQGGEHIDLPNVEENLQVGVYTPDGKRLAGRGPEVADEVTASAQHVEVDGVVGSERILADPILVNEKLVAVVRVSEPASDTTDRVRRDVLILVLFDLLAVAVAAGVGSFVAARLARPVRRLRDDAVRLGDGDFAVDPVHSGIGEIDETSEALADTAQRLEEMLGRERAFSADASHQLRTPLAALRLSIETELLDPRPDAERVLDEALTQVDRLESTISTLLAIARDRPPPRDLLDVDRLIGSIHRRWDDRFGATRRQLTCVETSPAQVHVSVSVLDQILDILLANALEHGAGDVAVRFRASAGGGLVIEVGDQGAIDRDPTSLFVRRDPAAAGHGVGLNLARALAEAEGGRLVLASGSSTTFRLVLPDAVDSSPAPGPT